MKHYKKRTIALCLASVITVVGAFGAENYKNSLMSLKINSGSDGLVSITAFTEKPLETKLQRVIVDSNTYVLRFPETNNSTVAPIVTDYNNISDIKIDTFPYTREKSGYTQVTIRTVGSPKIITNTKLFLSSKTNQNSETSQNNYSSTNLSQNIESSYDYSTPKASATVNEPPKQFVPPDYKKASSQGNAMPVAIAFFWVLVLSLLIWVIYNISKDKMDSVIGGGHSDFDLGDDSSSKTKKKEITKKKKSAKNLDTKISAPLKTSYDSVVSTVKNVPTADDVKKQEDDKEEEPVVVDLDSLYKEKTQTEEKTIQEEPADIVAEEDDLAEFLSEFTFDEELEEEPEEKEVFDEKLYNEVMNDSKLCFSLNDVKKINQLMQVEITEDTVTNLKEFLKTIKNKPKPLTKNQILENIITTYSIKQNITFTPEDIDAIKKLMDVELDKSFISDLRTKPERVKTVTKEIKNKKVNHKTSEIMTMNVKNLLPNLSEELKKQGNKKIESEVKPQVVYFSEGYDVSKFVVDLDLAKEIETNTSNDFKPSYSAPIVENGYEYTTLSTGNILPDLADVKANPKKYEEKEEEKVKVDENVLLKSISNVTFKPFYEETSPELDLFEEEKIEEKVEEIITLPNINLSEKAETKIIKIDDEAQKLLKLIEKQQLQRELKHQQNLEENNAFKKELEQASKKKELKELVKEEQPIVQTLENSENVIKSVSCNSGFSCNLVKTDNGYEIIGCVGDKQTKLKEYNELKSTNLQVRVNDKKSDGTIQYLVKIGLQKFIANVINDNMEFVMDLC